MIEKNWTDKFGEHFEVREKALGKTFSRKITRDPRAGWPVTWDECRASVLDAISEAIKADKFL